MLSLVFSDWDSFKYHTISPKRNVSSPKPKPREKADKHSKGKINVIILINLLSKGRTRRRGWSCTLC